MKIHIVNLLLTLVTFGVYSFWAKVKIRKYFYNETEIGGDRFDYHGTGKELMIGWLKVAVIFIVVFGAMGVMQTVWRGPMTQLLANLLLYTGLLFLVPVAIVGSRRYRLSRSSWRGIRFSFRGKAKEFIRIFTPGALLSAVTLGLYTPYFENNVRAYLIDNSYFGTRKFNYDGQGSELFGRYLKAYVLLFPTLGLYWFWFTAWRQRYYWSHTSYEGLRFCSDVTGGGLLGLSLGNLALLVLTLGLGMALGAGPQGTLHLGSSWGSGVGGPLGHRAGSPDGFGNRRRHGRVPGYRFARCGRGNLAVTASPDFSRID